MKKSTGVILVLIIVLLLGVIGVGGYFFIKENDDSNKEIVELKKEVESMSKNVENAIVQQNNNSNNNVTTPQNNNINTTKSYKDVKGTYESQKININTSVAPNYLSYKLILSEEGTFAYYHLDTDCHYVGYYTIVNDKLTLNSVVETGNDPSASLSNETTTLKINSDGTIVDTDRKFFHDDFSLTFSKTSENPREDTNIAKTINQYLAGCSTSGKDGQGSRFSGLSK